MHETSPLWKQILAEPNHRKEVKATINGNEYGESRIINASVSGKLFDAPGIGNASARTLKLDVMPPELPFGAIPPMSEIRCFVRLVSADGQRVSEYIPKGVFYADTVMRDSDTGMVSIDAFDAMMKMDLPFERRLCTITYDDGFGGIQKFERDIGNPMPTVENPAHDGAVFIGWNPAPENIVTRNVLHTARWSVEGASVPVTPEAPREVSLTNWGGVSWPRPANRVMREIADRIGVALDPRTTIPPYEMEEKALKMSMRTVAKYIAAMCAGNWTITDEGRLYLVPLAMSVQVLADENGTPLLFGEALLRV